MYNMVKKVTRDVLETKRAELSAYQARFDSAISVVTSTIDSLSRINEGIEQKVNEIAEYQDELEKTRVGLVDAKEKNARVIKNFSALINVD